MVNLGSPQAAFFNFARHADGTVETIFANDSDYIMVVVEMPTPPKRAVREMLIVRPGDTLHIAGEMDMTKIAFRFKLV